ncbi:hypothetical protein [Tenacibaculum sp. 190524A05c]|uniref:hypothetical protein n=1 Tax=Tenacibaculum platacis TaxID=3137852 RepID=UPI0032B15D66
MSNETASKQNTIVGGWTAYGPLTTSDRLVFDEATSGGKILGVDYTPEEVSTQVVGGTNYRFLCTAKPVGPMPIQWKAIVEIFKSLEGNVHVTGIQRL